MTNPAKILMVLLLTVITFTQCTKEEPQTNEDRRTVSMEITDAPIDDPNVSAVFITVAEIKVDGETFEGFTGKQTFNVKALQNGSVRVLGTGEIDAETATDVTLVLDLDTDASGNAMGCYVEDANGTKQSLAAGATGMLEITCKNAVNTAAETSSNTDIVMDFDLRKAITYNSNSSEYEFVSNTDLSASVRAVIKSKTGTIEGNSSQNSSNHDKIVAYAYKKGAYASSETNAQGSSNTQFANAITSAEVAADGSFNLSFLESGEYEVVFAAYDYNTQNKSEFKGMLEVGALLSGNILSTVTVNASASASLSINLFGLI